MRSLSSEIEKVTIFKKLESWITADAKLLANGFAFVCRAVNLGNINFILCLLVKLLPKRSKSFAMAAPRSIKLNKPWFLSFNHQCVSVNDQTIEVFSCEMRWLDANIDAFYLILARDKGNQKTQGK